MSKLHLLRYLIVVWVLLPAAILWAQDGTEIDFEKLEVISVENVERLQVIASISYESLAEIVWETDSGYAAVTFSDTLEITNAEKGEGNADFWIMATNPDTEQYVSPEPYYNLPTVSVIVADHIATPPNRTANASESLCTPDGRYVVSQVTNPGRFSEQYALHDPDTGELLSMVDVINTNNPVISHDSRLLFLGSICDCLPEAVTEAKGTIFVVDIDSLLEIDEINNDTALVNLDSIVYMERLVEGVAMNEAGTVVTGFDKFTLYFFGVPGE